MRPNISLSQKLKSILAICILLYIFHGFFICAFIFVCYGGLFLRSIFVLILVYQYLFAKPWKGFFDFFKSLEIFNYFHNFQCIFEDENERLQMQKNEQEQCKRLFLCCPHGVYSLSYFIAKYHINPQCSFDNFYPLISRIAYYTPFSGIICVWLNAKKVNKENMLSLMKQGNAIQLVPGGFEESSLIDKEKDYVFQKQRKGWVKYALQYGYTIHPCFAFNEYQLFNVFNFGKFSLMLNKIKIPGIVPFTKYFGYFPEHNVDLLMVVGIGIKFPQIEAPTTEDINKYHTIYLNSLQKLYDTYKVEKNRSLVIV